MILIGVLLLFMVSAGTCMSLDFRLMQKLWQERAAAIAMPSLRGILDRSNVPDLASENAILYQRVNLLEKKLELLESAPLANTALPPAVRPAEMATNGSRHGTGTTADARNERATGTNGCAPHRVEITAEEILFLTGEAFELDEQPGIPAEAKNDVVLKRFETYFPANGDLLQHADEARNFVEFVESAVIRALRMEGFAIQSEPVAQDFLAKFAAGNRFPLAIEPAGVRSFLARELIAYIAANPQKQVRGRCVLNGDPRPAGR